MLKNNKIIRYFIIEYHKLKLKPNMIKFYRELILIVFHIPFLSNFYIP